MYSPKTAISSVVRSPLDDDNLFPITVVFLRTITFCCSFMWRTCAYMYVCTEFFVFMLLQSLRCHKYILVLSSGVFCVRKYSQCPLCVSVLRCFTQGLTGMLLRCIIGDAHTELLFCSYKALQHSLQEVVCGYPLPSQLAPYAHDNWLVHLLVRSQLHKETVL